ncbi:MAG: YceI family protein [Candidatus Promineifilaceae bacterium]
MTWNIDYKHSNIEFTARHMMFTKVRGRFNEFEGSINFDPENPTNTTVNVEIQAATLETNDNDRDNHLRSADFLDVEKYPTITFVSKRVEQKDKNHGTLIGDLTILDQTREVSLDVEFFGLQPDPWGNTRAVFSGNTTINRKNWGLTWNVALEAGGFLVSDKLEINIEIQLVQVTETVPA